MILKQRQRLEALRFQTIVGRRRDERGIDLAHTTIMRWIQRYVPEFEKRWNRFACKAGRSWRVDETYVKIKGNWTYLYRAVDSEGKTVDFLLRAKRDVAAAKAFFQRAFEAQGRLPRAITLDGAGVETIATDLLYLAGTTLVFLGVGAYSFRWRPE